MKKLVPILLMCLGASSAFAQADKDGVTVSTDPAKAAAVEKHAQELKARSAQQAQTPGAAKAHKTAAKSKSKAKKKPTSAKPATTK